MTTDDVLTTLCSGDRQIWIVHFNEKIEACFITEIINYPQAKNCRLIIGTGKGRQYWQHWRGILEQWAKSIGCTSMEVFARTGWKKIFNDYKSTHVILEKEL